MFQVNLKISKLDIKVCLMFKDIHLIVLFSPADEYYNRVWEKIVDETAVNVYKFKAGSVRYPFKV